MAKWQWCLVDDTNNLLKGWQKIGDYWYYLYPNGVMAIGWIQLEDKWYYLNASGQMQVGWFQDSNSKWYYLQSNGVMYINCTATIDGKDYTFDNNGVWVENTNSLVSDKCIDFVKSWEGFSATPYQDEVGVWTLGYGMTGEEIEGITEVTEEQATTMLKDWINNKYATVIKADLDSKGITLAQNEFDALVSFAYNCGTDGLLGSTLYKNVVASIKDSETILANFQAWSNGGGMRIEGLYRRRTKEAAMFLNADYTGNC